MRERSPTKREEFKGLQRIQFFFWACEMKAKFRINQTFERKCYEDIKGLCKVATKDDIIKNDYSLTPGLYVGFNTQIDKDFDYQGRISKIHKELDMLNSESDKSYNNCPKVTYIICRIP